jgi:hypothetical protein
MQISCAPRTLLLIALLIGLGGCASTVPRTALPGGPATRRWAMRDKSDNPYEVPAQNWARAREVGWKCRLGLWSQWLSPCLWPSTLRWSSAAEGDHSASQRLDGAAGQ